MKQTDIHRQTRDLAIATLKLLRDQGAITHQEFRHLGDDLYSMVPPKGFDKVLP